MSNLLQLACPNCSALLNVAAPDGPTGQVQCGGCGHTFTFRASPAAPQNAPSNDLFGSLSDLGTPPPQSPAQPPPPARYGAGGGYSPPPARRPGGAGKGSKKGLIIAAVGISATLLIGIIGVVGVVVLRKADLIPASVSVFDSGEAILADADEIDLELQRIVNSLGETTVTDAQRKELVGKVLESFELLTRANKLAPLTDEQALALTDGVEEVDRPGSIFESKTVPESPLDDEARDAMRTKLRKIPMDQSKGAFPMVQRGLAITNFLREYLRYGHREFPTTTDRGEEIDVERIKLIRQFNLAGAKTTEKIDPLYVESLEDKEAAKAYILSVYQPMLSEAEEIAEKLYALANERYELAEEIKPSKRYSELEYYAEQMTGVVYGHSVGVGVSRSGELGPVAEVLFAAKDLDRAERGIMPSRLAKDHREKEAAAAERERAESERQAKIAMEQQRLDQELENERKLAAAEAKRKEALEEAKRRAESGEPDPNSVAGNQFGPFGSRMRGPGGRPGPAGMGSGRDRSRPGSFDPSNPGPGSFGPGSFGPGPRRGPRFGGGGPPMPAFDPKTGVTIQMDLAQGISPGNVTRKFSGPLQTSVSASSSNGRLVIRVSYTGSIDDVAKLIDFGKVVSKDAATRTIIVEPN